MVCQASHKATQERAITFVQQLGLPLAFGAGVWVRDIKYLLHFVEQFFTMINDKSPRYMQVCVCVCVCVLNLRDTEYTYPLCGGR